MLNLNYETSWYNISESGYKWTWVFHVLKTAAGDLESSTASADCLGPICLVRPYIYTFLPGSFRRFYYSDHLMFTSQRSGKNSGLLGMLMDEVSQYQIQMVHWTMTYSCYVQETQSSFSETIQVLPSGWVAMNKFHQLI